MVHARMCTLKAVNVAWVVPAGVDYERCFGTDVGGRGWLGR